MAVANVFAVFYVVAQVIERFVDFVKHAFNAYDDTRANIEAKELEIEDQKKIIETARDSGDNLSKHYERLNGLLKLKNRMDNKMLRDFFVFTSGLGILAAWLLQIRFLALLEAPVNPLLDTLVTGLVLGSGTKPLHDLIKYIEKAKT